MNAARSEPQAAQRRALGYVMNNEMGRISKRLRLNQSTIWNFFSQPKKTTRKVIQSSQRTYPELDANNFTVIFSHKWPLHVSDIYMSIFRSWILTDKQCTRLHTNSAGPQPQHLWHNTTCGSETTYIQSVSKRALQL